MSFNLFFNQSQSAVKQTRITFDTQLKTSLKSLIEAVYGCINVPVGPDVQVFVPTNANSDFSYELGGGVAEWLWAPGSNPPSCH